MSRQERRRAAREAAKSTFGIASERPDDGSSPQERVRMLSESELVAEARKVAGWMMDGGGPWAGSVLDEVALRLERAMVWAEHLEHEFRTMHMGGVEPDAGVVLWCTTCDVEVAKVLQGI